MALSEAKRYSESILELKRTIRLSPYNADYYYNIAVIQEKIADYEEAAESFEKFLNLNHNYPKIDEIKIKIHSLKELAKDNEKKPEKIDLTPIKNYKSKSLFADLKNLFK